MTFWPRGNTGKGVAECTWGLCLAAAEVAECEQTSVVTERSRPSERPAVPEYLGESGVLRGPDTFPHQELPELPVCGRLCRARCQGHKDESGFC